MRKIAFVVPWYGEKIPGGAESAGRDIAKNLINAGIKVEILTTCVKDFASDWNINFHKKGIEIIDDLVIRRFKVRERNIQAFNIVNYKLINNIKINEKEERIFLEEMINSPDLYTYIEHHKSYYDAFIFIPYMFGTSYYGIKACPEKSVLIPCLHEEAYAHLNLFKEIFEKCKGIIFLSEAEKNLAEKLYNIKNVKRTVIGTGIDTKVNFDGQKFKIKYHLKNPYILYAGRKDTGKNVHILIEFYKKFLELNPHIDLDLILIGGGSIDIHRSIQNHVKDLGFVSLEDKYNAYAGADIFCQPSNHESFSIVIMESWICGTPVIVNGECEVTKRFCIESNGGLYYFSYNEFEQCVKYFINNKEKAKIIGLQGKKFVEANFDWEVVTKQYIDFIFNSEFS